MRQRRVGGRQQLTTDGPGELGREHHGRGAAFDIGDDEFDATVAIGISLGRDRDGGCVVVSHRSLVSS